MRIRVNVEMNFKFEGRLEPAFEAQRTEFNGALHNFRNPDRKDKAIETMKKLAARKYPSGQFTLGMWMINGEGVPKEPEQGLELVKKAAEKDFGPALCQIGFFYINGQYFTMDVATGLKLVQKASTLNSAGAQYFLGVQYETGELLPADPDQAREQYRLCAARAVGRCQLRLGKLLLSGTKRKEPDAVEGVAWLKIARANEIPEAASIIDAEVAKLNPEQLQRVAKLERQLVKPAE